MGIKLSADQPCVIFGSDKSFGLIQIGNLYSDNTLVASATTQTGSVSNGKPGGRPGNADGCTCMCHSTGFGAIIWKVLNGFFKISGINQTCACGVDHY